MFGLTIILAALAGALVVGMRWPKSASLSVALLWLAVVALMFLGVGEWLPSLVVQCAVDIHLLLGSPVLQSK